MILFSYYRLFFSPFQSLPSAVTAANVTSTSAAQIANGSLLSSHRRGDAQRFTVNQPTTFMSSTPFVSSSGKSCNTDRYHTSLHIPGSKVSTGREIIEIEDDDDNVHIVSSDVQVLEYSTPLPSVGTSAGTSGWRDRQASSSSGLGDGAKKYRDSTMQSAASESFIDLEKWYGGSSGFQFMT